MVGKPDSLGFTRKPPPSTFNYRWDTSDYVIRKINCDPPKCICEARESHEKLKSAIEPLVKGLNPKDFEILVDLIFRQAGWQRVGVLGETEKAVDLDLLAPITNERYAVQIKSKASAADFESFREYVSASPDYSQGYFVVHTPQRDLREIRLNHETNSRIQLIFLEEISAYAVRFGLSEWVLRKAF